MLAADAKTLSHNLVCAIELWKITYFVEDSMKSGMYTFNQRCMIYDMWTYGDVLHTFIHNINIIFISLAVFPSIHT